MTYGEYCVVRLLDEDEDVVTVVSSNWMSQDRRSVKLPQVACHKWYKTVSSHEDPGNSFKVVRVQELVRTMDMQHAKQLELMYEKGLLQSSDDTIGMGTPPKRIRFQRHSYSPTPGTSLSPKAVNSTPLRPSPAAYVTSQSTPIAICNNPRAHTDSNSDDMLFERFKNYVDMKFQLCMEEQNLQRSLLLEISKTLNRLVAELESMKRLKAPELPIPVSSNSSLQSFDAQLSNQEFRQKVIDYLGNLPASSPKEQVQIILDTLISRDFAKEVNFVSNSLPFAFKNSLLHSIICTLVSNQFKENNVTVKAVSVIVRDYFHNARQRRGPSTGGSRNSKELQIVDLNAAFPEIHGGVFTGATQVEEIALRNSKSLQTDVDLDFTM